VERSHRLVGPTFVATLLLVTCSQHSPTTPTAPVASAPQTPAVTVTGVKVGVAGNQVPTLVVGGTLQFWAVADYSDGTSQDVTNRATWQSSSPVVATV